VLTSASTEFSSDRRLPFQLSSSAKTGAFFFRPASTPSLLTSPHIFFDASPLYLMPHHPSPSDAQIPRAPRRPPLPALHANKQGPPRTMIHPWTLATAMGPPTVFCMNRVVLGPFGFAQPPNTRQSALKQHRLCTLSPSVMSFFSLPLPPSMIPRGCFQFCLTLITLDRQDSSHQGRAGVYPSCASRSFEFHLPHAV